MKLWQQKQCKINMMVSISALVPYLSVSKNTFLTRKLVSSMTQGFQHKILIFTWTFYSFSVWQPAVTLLPQDLLSRPLSRWSLWLPPPALNPNTFVALPSIGPGHLGSLSLIIIVCPKLGLVLTLSQVLSPLAQRDR